MSTYENPVFWAEQTIEDLINANDELNKARESFLKAIKFGALQYEPTEESEIIKDALNGCFEEIFYATAACRRILENIPAEKETEDNSGT